MLGAVVAVIVLLIIGAITAADSPVMLAAAIVVLDICTRLSRWRSHDHHLTPIGIGDGAMTLSTQPSTDGWWLGH